MAKSKYEYVKGFEMPDPVLPNTWMLVRIDGRGFHKFTAAHDYEKPNDLAGLKLMNRCALECMNEFKDIQLAYGESDEYSFVFGKKCTLFSRRSSRLVTYPSNENLRDYLSWRQADCHINNMYNTCFWMLVQSGLSTTAAEDRLKGTLSAEKNELLFTEFNTNYNALPAQYRKGTTCVRLEVEEHYTKTIQRKDDGSVQEVSYTRTKRVPTETYEDIIGEEFWKKYPYIMDS